MMKRILITGANSDVCQSLARILRSHERYQYVEIIGTAPDGEWPAKACFDKIFPVPFADNPTYFSTLKAIVEDTSPDLLLPFSEAELAFFHSHPERLSALKIPVLINPPAVLAAFLDKQATADLLSRHGITTPRTKVLSDALSEPLPLFIKPRSSAGSKNVAVIRNAMQFEGFVAERMNDLHRYVAQELIDAPDAEYTCAFWRMGGELRTCTLWRRLQGGMTGVAKVCQNAAIDAMLQKLATVMHGDLVLNVQLRLRDGVPVVFEINPRFSSTVMMRHKIGFEDFIWSLDYLMSNRLPPLWVPPVDTMLYRISDELVVRPGR